MRKTTTEQSNILAPGRFGEQPSTARRGQRDRMYAPAGIPPPGSDGCSIYNCGLTPHFPQICPVYRVPCIWDETFQAERASKKKANQKCEPGNPGEPKKPTNQKGVCAWENPSVILVHHMQ